MVWRFSTSGKHGLPHVSVMVRCETVSLLVKSRGFVSVSLTHVSNSHIWEAIRLVWPESHWADDGNYRGIESRL